MKTILTTLILLLSSTVFAEAYDNSEHYNNSDPYETGGYVPQPQTPTYQQQLDAQRLQIESEMWFQRDVDRAEMRHEMQEQRIMDQWNR